MRLDPDASLFTNPSARGSKEWKRTAEATTHETPCAVAGAYFPPNQVGRHAFGTHAHRRFKEATGTHDIEALRKGDRP